MNATEKQTGIVKLLSNHIETFTVWDEPELVEQTMENEQLLLGVTLWANLMTVNFLNQILLQCVETLHQVSPFRDQQLHAIKKSFHTKFNLSSLSKELALSQAQLERNCHREFGCSVMELYHRIRMNRACSLLVNPELNLEQISGMLGFYDQAHFSRFFKQRMQVTPRNIEKNIEHPLRFDHSLACHLCYGLLFGFAIEYPIMDLYNPLISRQMDAAVKHGKPKDACLERDVSLGLMSFLHDFA